MSTAAKKALTEADIAALVSGAPAAAALAATTAPSVAAVVTEAAPAAEVAPAVVAEAAAAAVVADVPPATAPAAAAAAPAAVANDVAAFLNTQIVAKDAALLANGIEIAGLKSKIADTEASVNGLKAIAASAINNMRVALGGSKTDLAALSATELLAQHSAAVGEFGKKFVAGGVAAVDAAQATKPTAATTLAEQRLQKISA